MQVNSSGSFAGQASVLTGGTPVQRAVECASGVVDYNALRALPNGVGAEYTIQTNVSGNVRWDQVLMSETTQFAGVNALTVSMGRPGTTNHDEMSGAAVSLDGIQRRRELLEFPPGTAAGDRHVRCGAEFRCSDLLSGGHRLGDERVHRRSPGAERRGRRP